MLSNTPNHVLQFAAKLKYDYGLNLDGHREKRLLEDIADMLQVDRGDAIEAHNAKLEKTSKEQSARMLGTTPPVGTFGIKGAPPAGFATVEKTESAPELTFSQMWAKNLAELKAAHPK